MRAPRMRVWAALLLLAAGAPRPMLAQTWHLGVQGGRIRSTLDPDANATSTLSAGLRLEAPRTAFRAVGGVPTARQEPLWGSLALWQRVATRGGRGWLAGLDLTGVGFLSHDRAPAPAPLPGGGGIFGPPPTPGLPTQDRSGHAVAGQALPVVGYESSSLQLHARGGVSHFAARLGDGQMDRTVGLGDLQLTALPWPTVALVTAVRHYRASDEPDVTYAGLTTVLASSRARLSATLGYWSGVPGTDIPWAVSARALVASRLAIELAARRDSYDPLHAQPAQTSWGVGASIQIGGRTGPPPLPVPAAYADGQATLELPATASRGVPSIAGDFTDWKPVPMQREGRVWRHVLRLQPGVYHYAFVDASGRWFVPKEVPGRRDDGMGGHVAVVVVE